MGKKKQRLKGKDREIQLAQQRSKQVMRDGTITFRGDKYAASAVCARVKVHMGWYASAERLPGGRYRVKAHQRREPT